MSKLESVNYFPSSFYLTFWAFWCRCSLPSTFNMLYLLLPHYLALVLLLLPYSLMSRTWNPRPTSDVCQFPQDSVPASFYSRHSPCESSDSNSSNETTLPTTPDCISHPIQILGYRAVTAAFSILPPSAPHTTLKPPALLWFAAQWPAHHSSQEPGSRKTPDFPHLGHSSRTLPDHLTSFGISNAHFSLFSLPIP